MEPASYISLRQELQNEMLGCFSKEDEYKIDKRMARAVLFRANLLSLDIIGKNAVFHELFPGIEAPNIKKFSINEIWAEKRYQRALHIGLMEKYNADPKTYSWIPQRQRQLETLLKARISFQKLSHSLSQTVLTTEVPHRSNPSAADILRVVLESKVDEFQKKPDELKWDEFFDLLNCLPSQTLGQLFEISIAKFEKSRSALDAFIIFLLLYMVVDYDMDFTIFNNFEPKRFQEKLDGLLQSCQFNKTVPRHKIVEMLIYRSSEKRVPVLLRAFQNNEEASNALSKFIVSQFINLTSIVWPDKDKALLNFLELIQRSKGQEVVQKLIKDAKDQQTIKLATLLNQIYEAKTQPDVFRSLYELYHLSEHINSRLIQAIFGISFKPYILREMKIKNVNPKAFPLFFNARNPVVVKGNSLFGITTHNHRSTIVALNIETKVLMWSISLNYQVSYFAKCPYTLIVETSFDKQVSYYDLKTGERTGHTYLPNFRDPDIPNSLYITDSSYCYMVTVKDGGRLLEGGLNTRNKWKRTFTAPIESGQYHHLGDFFAVENRQTKRMTVFNTKGEKHIIENCTDIHLVKDEFLFTAELHPTEPSKSLLKVMGLENIKDATIQFTVPFANMKIAGACDGGWLVAYSDDQPKTLAFINWQNSHVVLQEIGVPFDKSSYIDKKTGTVWLINREKNDVIGCTKDSITSIGSIDLTLFTKLVYVVDQGVVYYCN